MIAATRHASLDERFQLEADVAGDHLKFRLWPKPSLATSRRSTAKLTFGAAPSESS